MVACVRRPISSMVKRSRDCAHIELHVILFEWIINLLKLEDRIENEDTVPPSLLQEHITAGVKHPGVYCVVLCQQT